MLAKEIILLGGILGICKVHFYSFFVKKLVIVLQMFVTDTVIICFMFVKVINSSSL